jgi:hypothetical protein
MPPYRNRQRFPNWVPDVSDQMPDLTADVQNVLPVNSGWAPFPSFAPFTAALPAPCRGFFYGRNPDGSVTIFAGTAPSRLYVLNNTSLSWTDASQGGVAYTPLASTANWEFAQFNQVVIAVQGLCNPQAFTLGVSTAFADLGGSPPQSAFVSVVNRFLVLSGIPAQPYRIQWCDLDNITQWTAGVGQADFQDLPDGGRALGIAGFDLYAVVLQDAMARLMTYAPGSPVVFTITKITGGDGNGLFAPYAWEVDQDNVFWLSQEGFKMLTPGGAPQPIGKEIVDRYIFGTLDTGNLQLCVSTTDPAASRLYIAYKSTSGAVGAYDTILIYDWRLARWSRAFQSGQYITTMVRPGTTLEGMDAPTPGAVGITGFSAGASNGAGGNLVRVQVTSTAGMATAQQQTVFGKWNLTQVNSFATLNNNCSAVLGAAINNVMNNANSAWGSWAINIIDGTHVDLLGSTIPTSGVTYTSGGVLGGNIELIPFSFDTVSTATLPSLSAIDINNRMGFYNGPNLQAIVESGEQGLPDKRMFVRGFRCISDASAIVGNVSYRDNPQAPYNYTAEVGLDGFTGTILVAGGGVDTRYARVRVRVPANAQWTYIMAFEPDVDTTGIY